MLHRQHFQHISFKRMYIALFTSHRRH